MQPYVCSEKDKRDHEDQRTLPYSTYHYSEHVKQYHFYISEELGNANQYADMIHTIRTAAPQDIIYIYLNTPGGNAFAGAQIINAINNSKGTIITVLDGYVASMGALIFLAGDEFLVQEHSIMMIHTYSASTSGRGPEITVGVDAMDKWFKTCHAKLYEGFLTDSEIVRVNKGEDFYFDALVVKKRLHKMVTYLKKKRKEQQSQDKASISKQIS